MSRSRGLAYLGVLIVALAIVFSSVLKHPYYTADGLAYARFAARDTGMSERDATLSARRFYEHTPLMNAPRYRALVEIDPSVSFKRTQIFANRLLFPAMVSVLYPVAGFRALFIVSAVAYVCFGMALLWLLTAFRSDGTAFVLTLAALALPLTRSLAATDLTDVPAAVFWTVALGALLRSMVLGRSRALLATLAIASVLLVLTRPTPYLILLPALAAALLRGMWAEFAACALSAVAFLIAAAATRAYGVMEQLRWIYTQSGSQATPLRTWFAGALMRTARATAASEIRSVYPVLGLVSAVVALRGPYRDCAVVLLAAFVACLLSVVFNPVPGQIGRVVDLPLVPVFAAMVQIAAVQLLEGRRLALRDAPAR